MTIAREETVVLGEFLPVLPLRDGVLFPGAIREYDLGCEAPPALVDALLASPVVAVFGQLDPSIAEPHQADLHTVGCAAQVLKAREEPSRNTTLVLHGLARIRLDRVTRRAPYLEGKITLLQEENGEDLQARALAARLRDIAKGVVQLMPEMPGALALIESVKEPSSLTDLIANNIDMSLVDKAAALRTTDVTDRVCYLLLVLSRQLELLEMRARIASRIRVQLDRDLEDRDGSRPPEKESRTVLLRLERTTVEEELGEYASAQTGSEQASQALGDSTVPTVQNGSNDASSPGGPYRASHAGSPTAGAHRIDLHALVGAHGPSRWRAPLSFLGVGRERRILQSIDDQLTAIRTSLRKEVLIQELEAITEQLRVEG